jgi:hypothetical protein
LTSVTRRRKLYHGEFLGPSWEIDGSYASRPGNIFAKISGAYFATMSDEIPFCWQICA